MTAQSRMHLSPSSFDAAEPLRTNCGLFPLFGPWIFTDPNLKVCSSCVKSERKRGTWHGVEYVDGKWRRVRAKAVFTYWPTTTSSSSCTFKITWKLAS